MREADRAHAQQLAGEQVVGARHGEHDLEDARAFFFDDGAGHIHAVEQNGHGHEEGHEHGLEERAHALAFTGLAAARDQQCVEVHGFCQRRDFLRRHSLLGETQIEKAVIDGVFQTRGTHQIARGLRNISDAGRARGGAFDDEQTVEGFVCDACLESGAVLCGEGRDDIDGVAGAFFLGEIVANIGGQRGVIGGDGDVPVRGQFAAGDGADAEKKDDE